MPSIESVIEGSEKLTKRFGYWPSFHDAEVLDVHLWRGDVDPDRQRYVFPVLTAKLHVWELTQETDTRGYLVLRHHTLATLRFHGLDETLKLEGFNQQNAIFELLITQQTRTNGTSPYFEVQFVSSYGMGASFTCHRVEVVDAVACDSRGFLNAEPGAPPNGGPATHCGNSGVTEGPPSVS